MKTILTIILAVATIVAGAVEHPKLEIQQISAKSAVITLDNENPAKFEITLKAKDGSIVYQTKTFLTTDGYRKVFNFSELENGTYEFSAKANDTSIKRNIEIENSGFKVGESTISLDPYFKKKGDILELTYLNYDQNEIYLTVLNEDKVYFEASLGKDFSTQDRINFKQLESGTYDVILADGSNNFYYKFKK